MSNANYALLGQVFAKTFFKTRGIDTGTVTLDEATLAGFFEETARKIGARILERSILTRAAEVRTVNQLIMHLSDLRLEPPAPPED